MKTPLRTLLLAMPLAIACLDASAQQRSRPAGTMPLNEPPPPPAMVQPDPALEEGVTVRTEGDQTVQEYRANGKVYMQRVTPKHGRPYVLMDNKGDATFTRQDNTLDQGVRVPQWVLAEF